jgi:hypothetical protein
LSATALGIEPEAETSALYQAIRAGEIASSAQVSAKPFPSSRGDTDYFASSVLARRPYLKREWIGCVLDSPERTEVQPNGRIRHWAFIPELGTYLRVVTGADGTTVHNAFRDLGFDLT